MIRRVSFFIVLLFSAALVACSPAVDSPSTAVIEEGYHKPVVYQIFTRLFGNTETANTPWGTLQQNGVGKFNDINDDALIALRDMGVTHIWYTGVLHHAMVADYRAFGIDQDDPDVVKGRAGSPYAVKDYYDVNPDLAVDPAKRLEEFQALVKRTQQQGMKVIIDIVPNHVARHYRSTMKPAGVRDFGEDDNTAVEYARDNNFYYVPGEAFLVPKPLDGYRPLGGEVHPLSDNHFDELPAKWTGNGAREAQPHFHDWYETVKINYGVRPDGSYDFPRLPAGLASQPATAHAAFWEKQQVPDSWKKFRDITRYWLEMGVDGFRFDMAEMVPVEFWSYLNSSILMRNPDAFLLAEIYNPLEYRNYIYSGKMGYLYDKVGLYDALRDVIAGELPADSVLQAREEIADISGAMLNFLENHDEQRIASSGFAGDAWRGLPAMVVAAALTDAPIMIYFGQEVGEQAEQDMGFGSATRTTIFDYAGVPAHQRWMNGGRFDGGSLTDEERALRNQYRTLLRLVKSAPALQGGFFDLHRPNVAAAQGYDEHLFAFSRWNEEQKWIVVANFSSTEKRTFSLTIPAALISAWQLRDGEYPFTDKLESDYNRHLEVVDGVGKMSITLPVNGAVILEKI